ncbi:MAG: saccharopine dehydrogenase NADP-binding domain-containing protein [Burkholderiaceae bacterium]|nr:saccharopine dehydrogenase NADP-binding domain-containing protein [Burkholderiaceae bacterium]
MRTVVLGASGNFGRRILRALKTDPKLELIAAGRTGADPIDGVCPVALDIRATDFEERLSALAPQLVIHCVGPFQGQDYHVTRAALTAGAHYLDLADGRQFVAGFSAANHEAARAAGRLALSGASTLPALSSAVIETLREPLVSIQEIDIAIAPGQRSPRGVATLEAVFSYLGRPFSWMHNGRWERAWGWQELRRIRFDIGTRWAAACDVPDLALYPQQYPGLTSVTFRAALEVGIQHFALWILAAARRAGPPLPIERWAAQLDRLASLLDMFGSDRGAMRVSIVGTGHDGARHRRTWQLSVQANHGPEIPCLASILLARKFARGEVRAPSGAYPCIGFLKLIDFEEEFARWAIRTRVEAAAA